MNLKEREENLKTDIPALYLSLKDKRTAPAAKILAALAVGYALSPIDLIPDFIPFLGYLDDLIILPLLVLSSVKLIPKEVFDENRIKAKEMWKNGRPKKWYFAIPIILIYLLIIFLIVKAIFF